jgi:hypothetical protein
MPVKASTLAADVLLNFKQPAGVMAAANLMVVVHVAAAWQVRLPQLPRQHQQLPEAAT